MSLPVPMFSGCDFAEPCGGYRALKFDLDETLKAVLHFYGPEGAYKITSHVMMARRSRDSNALIDEIEAAIMDDKP